MISISFNFSEYFAGTFLIKWWVNCIGAHIQNNSMKKMKDEVDQPEYGRVVESSRKNRPYENLVNEV